MFGTLRTWDWAVNPSAGKLEISTEPLPRLSQSCQAVFRSNGYPSMPTAIKENLRLTATSTALRGSG